MNDVIGTNIARLRKEKNMTQEQLANLLGISYQAVSKWENGLSSPDVSTFPILADTFGVTIDELFGRTAAPREDASTEQVPAELPWPDDECLYAVLYYGHEFIGAADAAEKKKIEFSYEGPALNIKSAFTVNVEGNVEGNVEAGGSVTCDAVGGSVKAGGGVTCDDVKGDVNSGSGVTCDNVSGSVIAGVSVTCDNVTGNVTAGVSVQCDNVEGRISWRKK